MYIKNVNPGGCNNINEERYIFFFIEKGGAGPNILETTVGEHPEIVPLVVSGRF